MKLSCNTFMYSSFPAWLPAYPIDYVIERLSAIGYDGIELGCASPVAYPPYSDDAERARIRDMLKKHNIAISSVLPCLGGDEGSVYFFAPYFALGGASGIGKAIVQGFACEGSKVVMLGGIL